MSVRIRMKKFGRKHRPYYRICAMDIRRPRDGRVLEELGSYDPMILETDARAILNGERINYWLSVGAQPSDKVRVLIKKYGASGTHAEAQRLALARLSQMRRRPEPMQAMAKASAQAQPIADEGEPVEPPHKPAVEEPREEVQTEAPAEVQTEAPVEAPAEVQAETPAETPVEAPVETQTKTPEEVREDAGVTEKPQQ